MVDNLSTNLAHPEFRHCADELCSMTSLIIDGVFPGYRRKPRNTEQT